MDKETYSRFGKPTFYDCILLSEGLMCQWNTDPCFFVRCLHCRSIASNVIVYWAHGHRLGHSTLPVISGIFSITSIDISGWCTQNLGYRDEGVTAQIIMGLPWIRGIGTDGADGSTHVRSGQFASTNKFGLLPHRLAKVGGELFECGDQVV
jgi:hypothetical protein